MSNISKIVAINLVAIALVACGNSGTGNDGQTQTPAPATEPAPVAAPTPVVEPTQENLPGTYSGMLPCGDCKGVITKLQLIADGTYKVNETFDGKGEGEGAVLDSDGKWNFDPASRRVTLDPTAQDWQDRVFEAVATGALRPLDGNDVPYSTDGLHDLRVVK